MFDTMGVDRQPVEHAPDKWRGELDSLHIRYDGDPTPRSACASSGLTAPNGEVNGCTSEWTRTHVCIYPASRRRRITRFGCQPSTFDAR